MDFFDFLDDDEFEVVKKFVGKKEFKVKIVKDVVFVVVVFFVNKKRKVVEEEVDIGYVSKKVNVEGVVVVIFVGMNLVKK